MVPALSFSGDGAGWGCRSGPWRSLGGRAASPPPPPYCNCCRKPATFPLLPPDPLPPPPFPSTIKSRHCQSSRRGHESLSAACSSPEPPPPRHPPPLPAGASDISPGTGSCRLPALPDGPERFGAGPCPGTAVRLQLVPGRSPAPEKFRLPRPGGSVAPRPVACVGALLGLVGAPEPLCGLSRAGGTGWTSPGCVPGGLYPSGGSLLGRSPPGFTPHS